MSSASAVLPPPSSGDTSGTTDKEKVPDANEDGLTDQTNFLPARQVITVFLGLSTALMCSFLDQTIVATALPKISSDLHSGRESSWVATAYLLTSLACTPIYGRWSDIFGRKVVLLASLAIFWLFSLACALARTMIQLIIFRAFQGVGGGAIISMVLIIVSDIVSLKNRGKYQGINEATIAIATGIGPILGGVFSQDTTWRWAFWINLPLGGIAIAVSIWVLPLKQVHGDMKSKFLKVDYIGSLLTIISSVLVLLGLTWGGITFPWISAQVLVPLILGVAVFVFFLFWEAYYAALPIIPVRIFRVRTVVGVYICTLMNGMTFFALLYYVPQFLQVVRGNSPILSGAIMLPFLAPIAVFVFLCGQITARVGRYRPMIIVGFAVWAVSLGLASTIGPESSTGKIVGLLLMGGIAAGGTFQTSLIAAQAAVPRSDMAVVTGVRNFVRLLGSTVSLAICASIVNNELRTAVEPLHLTKQEIDAITDDPTSINRSGFSLGPEARKIIIDGYAKGFKGVFYLGMACIIVAFLSATFLIQHHPLERADDQELKDAGRQRLAAEKARKAEKGGHPKDIEAQTPAPLADDTTDEKAV